MITLCMDTSHVFLVLGIIEDDRVIANIQKECWKKQSEEIFPQLIEMFSEAGLKPENIDQIVISKGPGSYTGVRIAMTIAKVFCAMKEVPLYTIGTLDLYAGNETCRVLVDARGKRAYTALYNKGILQNEAEVLPCEEIIEKQEDIKVIGDGHLIGKEDCWPDIVSNFALLKDRWTKEENVHLVVPEYMKPSEAYLIKK